MDPDSALKDFFDSLETIAVISMFSDFLMIC